MKPLNITNNLASLLVKYIAIHEIESQAALLDKLKRHHAGETLDYGLWCQYLAELSHCTGHHTLGIELGELAEAEHGGILAYLVSSCETLGDALVHFTRYQSLLYGGEALVESKANNILIRWQPEVASSIGTQISDEVLIVGLVCFIKRLVGHLNELPKVGFIHPRPSYYSAYCEHLGNDLKFGRKELTVEFPVKDLSLKIKNPEPALKDILQQQAEALLLKGNESNDRFYQQVKAELILCINESEMTLDELSLRMNLSSRTLHRRLQELGINLISY